ncbi:GIY-YIG nuclease family protein [Afipia massiliensis]|uniref:GIY-YIG nuclease family protein n=1 Tax=Afipia massiliensis TaxID=211460 RepID=A0A4U6BYC7_9BRAD|nr:GIY-YIG nuclease family protein [Afipia massiliensis]
MTSLQFRKAAMRKLTTEIGVYVLCDLDEVPIYVGQSIKGIRGRVSRHLTSARSDVIANRQIDVWEIAYVKAWPVKRLADIPHLEARLFKTFDKRKALMNGSIPNLSRKVPQKIPSPAQTIQVMSDEDIKVRRDPMLRLPRQIEHIGRLVDHILSVKDSAQLRRSLAAHFERLDAYREAFLRQTGSVRRAPGETDEE